MEMIKVQNPEFKETVPPDRKKSGETIPFLSVRTGCLQPVIQVGQVYLVV